MKTSRTALPASLNLRAIDADARDGRYRLLTDGQQIAVGCWRETAAGGEWTFPGGTPLHFQPSEYKP